ncbi:MAG: hypothetical protein LBG90_00740 [Spirochaetaceae bacterium]|nr:hypothetical protein [Spirochaetaceae bacterium]
MKVTDQLAALYSYSDQGLKNIPGPPVQILDSGKAEKKITEEESIFVLSDEKAKVKKK